MRVLESGSLRPLGSTVNLQKAKIFKSELFQQVNNVDDFLRIFLWDWIPCYTKHFPACLEYMKAKTLNIEKSLTESS